MSQNGLFSLKGQVADMSKRIEDLADAVPADKYAWRPGDGVRSISEVYMHIAGANYLFMTFVGVKPPMKMDPGMEKSVTDKTEIAGKLKASFEHFRNGVIGLSDKDLDKTASVFGNTMTYRNVLITAIALSILFGGRSGLSLVGVVAAAYYFLDVRPRLKALRGD